MKTYLALCSAALVAACATSQAPAPSAAAPTPTAHVEPAHPQAAPAQAAPPQAAPPQAAALPPHLDPGSTLSQKHSVFFAYDRYDIAPQYNDVVELHAHYLSSHQDLKVRIEGNADERGSAEYNLALGNKRANAVRQSMTVLGVKNDQIETVSFGSEKPLASAHNETAWAENRRADIVYAKQ